MDDKAKKLDFKITVFLYFLFYFIALVVGIFGLYTQIAKAETYYGSFNDGWRCSVNYSAGIYGDLTYGIEKSELGDITSVNSQSLRIGVWTYNAEQSFSVLVTSSQRLLADGRPTPDGSWVIANEILYSRTDTGMQSLPSADYPYPTDSFTGETKYFTFPSNSVGENITSTGTIWFVLRAGSGTNVGDRFCVQVSDQDFVSWEGSYPLGETLVPYGAMQYTVGSTGATGGFSSSTPMDIWGGFSINWGDSSNTQTAINNIYATSTLSDVGETFLGSATATIPGCFLYQGLQMTDLFWGLTHENLQPQSIYYHFASTTFEMSMVYDTSTIPSFAYEIRSVAFNLYYWIGFMALCWLIWQDFTNSRFNNKGEGGDFTDLSDEEEQ